MRRGPQRPQRPEQRPGPATVPPKRYPLPRDTQDSTRSQGHKCRNLGLWLDRFLPYEQKGDNWELPQQTKCRQDAPLNLQPVKPLLDAWIKRWQGALESYQQHGFKVEQFKATPEWRLVTGLGAPHVLETSLTLHRVYGFPFIPGSTVKGVTRAYAELVLRKGEDNPEFRRVFGSQVQAGEVIFFDAIPAQPPQLRLDVMNPHYSEYYQGGNTPPADWLSPKPVYFLTVERTPFLFALGARTKGANGLVATVAGWLKQALQDLGVGAKTAAGYGYFKSNNE